jgi:hypothetical protein
MSINYVRNANGLGASDINISFAENQGGDTLVAVFAATAASADFVDPSIASSELVDLIGNIWTLIYSEVNNENMTFGTYNALAIYVCNRCIDSLIGTQLLMPTELQPVHVTATWSNGFEFATTFAEFIFDVVNFIPSTVLNAPYTITVGPTTTKDLLIAGVFDSHINAVLSFEPPSVPPDTFKSLPTVGTHATHCALAWDVSLNSDAVVANVFPQANDVFMFVLAMTGSNSAGKSSSKALTFSINKGPLPVPPKEGRAIATVQIDCTQQLVIPPPINYPEYAICETGLSAPTGFVVCEFDLEHLFQGSGLSEVRTLCAWCRPMFSPTNNGQRDDSPGGNIYPQPAILTNKITLQTILLGSNAAQTSTFDSESYGEFLILPFPGNKNGLKYRFIAPQSSLINPQGKYNLQFLNFEVMGAIESAAGLLSTVQS